MAVVNPRDLVYGCDSGRSWVGIPQGHKWLNYLSVYEREFSGLRSRPVKVLEIGVYRGASLKLWKQYFGAASQIVGIDVDETCSAHADPDHDVHVRIGSQSDANFLRTLFKEFGPFDLIIDDGSHCSSHQIASFNALFDEGLKMGGVYFVEDLECVYWGDRTGHLDQEVSAVDFFKMLIDLPHQIFRGKKYEDFALHCPQYFEAGYVAKIATLVESVGFYRGCAAVRKNFIGFPQVLHI